MIADDHPQLIIDNLRAQEIRVQYPLLYNGNPDKPTLSHSFGAFLAVDSTRDRVETQIINWLPAKGEAVRLLAFQNGQNYSLEETLAIAGDRRVGYLGPYETTEALYRGAVKQVRILASGKVRYKMLDWRARQRLAAGFPGAGLNCIDAIVGAKAGATIDEAGWGRKATLMILERFRRELIQPAITEPEVLGLLGLAGSEGEIIRQR